MLLSCKACWESIQTLGVEFVVGEMSDIRNFRMCCYFAVTLHFVTPAKVFLFLIDPSYSILDTLCFHMHYLPVTVTFLCAVL